MDNGQDEECGGVPRDAAGVWHDNGVVWVCPPCVKDENVEEKCCKKHLEPGRIEVHAQTQAGPNDEYTW